MAELLWETNVGTHVRSREREEEVEAARISAAYERGKRHLPREEP